MKNRLKWIAGIGSAFAAGALFFWWWSVRPEGLDVPKPKGYFVISLPDTASQRHSIQDGIQASFRMNRAAQWKTVDASKGWATLVYPSLGAEIQLSYVRVSDQLPKLLDDAHQLAYKHDVVAQGIREKLYSDSDRSVHGLLYLFQGNTATPCQFYITDSTHHFLRGSVYIMAKPNADSLAPVHQFLEQEVVRLMESTRWSGMK